MGLQLGGNTRLGGGGGREIAVFPSLSNTGYHLISNEDMNSKMAILN